MAAQEQHLQRVFDVVQVVGHRCRPVELTVQRIAHLATAASALGPSLVDEAPRRDPHQPSTRALRNAVAGPLLDRRGECLLGGVLTIRERVTPTQQGSEHVRRLPTPHVPDILRAGGHSRRGREDHSSVPECITGRSSMVSPGQENASAICSARSRDSTSMTKNPARCSLPSAYGPSVGSGRSS